jgi:putative photosynthetic complex assembly protein
MPLHRRSPPQHSNRKDETMSDPFENQQFPRGVLYGVAALIGFMMVAVVFGRFGGDGGGPTETFNKVAIESRSLRFEDRTDGGVTVIDVTEDRLVAVLEPGTNNFIRGVVRGLARDRMLRNIGPRPPFQLTLWDSGALTLEDHSTGRVIDLNAFGATNLAAFAQFLEFNEKETVGDTAYQTTTGSSGNKTVGRTLQ